MDPIIIYPLYVSIYTSTMDPSWVMVSRCLTSKPHGHGFDHKRWPFRQGDDPGTRATDFRSPSSRSRAASRPRKKNIRAEPHGYFLDPDGGPSPNTGCVWWWKKDPCSWCLHIWKYCNVARISTTFAMFFSIDIYWHRISLVEGIKCEQQLQASLQFSPQQLQTQQYIYIIYNYICIYI